MGLLLPEGQRRHVQLQPAPDPAGTARPRGPRRHGLAELPVAAARVTRRDRRCPPRHSHLCQRNDPRRPRQWPRQDQDDGPRQGPPPAAPRQPRAAPDAGPQGAPVRPQADQAHRPELRAQLRGLLRRPLGSHRRQERLGRPRRRGRSSVSPTARSRGPRTRSSPSRGSRTTAGSNSPPGAATPMCGERCSGGSSRCRSSRP